jgi:hypothetical protein
VRSRKHDEALNSDDPDKKPKRGMLERVRSRIDRYRELGKARRERLEEAVRNRGRKQRPGDAILESAATATYEPLPGTARAVLSGQDFAELERELGYTIKHRGYFLQALTHRSYLQFVQNPTLQSNERLEFLGDSILNLVVAEYLYRRCPKGSSRSCARGLSPVRRLRSTRKIFISSDFSYSRLRPIPLLSEARQHCLQTPMKRSSPRSISMAALMLLAISSTATSLPTRAVTS